MNTIDILSSEEELKIVLQSKASLWARAILAVLSLLSLTGLVSTITQAFRQPQFDFLEFFIPFIIISICVLYFVRLFLWNQAGQEIIEINKRSYSYYHDYAWFQTEKEILPYRSLTARVATQTSSQVDSEQAILDEDFLIKKDHLIVDLGESTHESSIPVERRELLRIVQIINEYHQKNKLD